MTVTTESGGRQNIYSTEPRPYIDESVSYEGYPQNAEKVNGRWGYDRFRCTTRCICNNRTNHSGCILMNYWKEAEQINGRLAMAGFFALVVNYGLTGWIIPSLF